ncbi:MAG: hypothetical protein GEV10_04145 [Streptosporangiales bacterium]|nr:hypothetical protein [Streptosporangiales bacterium]
MTVNGAGTPGEFALETLNTGERAGFHTTKHLAHAAAQAKERRYDDFLIVDADAHHYENESWPDIVKYIEDPVLRFRAQGGGYAGNAKGTPAAVMLSPALDQSNSGRVIRYPRRRLRLGVGRAIIGMVVAEFFTAITGLGALIVKYGNQFDTASMLVPVFLLMLLGVALTALIRRAERWIAPWKESERQR